MKQEVQEVVDQIKSSEDFFQKAKLIEFLQKQKDVSTKKLSEYLEIKPSYLCHIARLNKLPELVIDGYYSKLISVSHLFIIARLKDIEQMTKAYEEVLSKSLTVLQTEELIREYLYDIKSDGLHISKEEVEAAKARIRLLYKNASVKVVQSRIKAKVQLEIKGSLKQTSQTLKLILEILSK